MSYGSTLADITLNDVAELEKKFTVSVALDERGDYQISVSRKYEGAPILLMLRYHSIAIALAATFDALDHIGAD